jgi:hypothetical protein
VQARRSRTREALATWRSNAAEQGAERRMLHHAVMRMAHAKLAAALAGWRAAAAARRRKRGILQVGWRLMNSQA